MQIIKGIQNEKVQVSLAQIPWYHHISLLTKVKSMEQRLFYMRETAENGWSRDTMLLQVKSNLYERQGSAITNFEHTLPTAQSDLAKQTIKDPYVFDFLTLTEDFKEKYIENQLIEHVSKFLLELGKGFAFLGKQYHLEVADQDYYLDLLFYHTILKCHVVIELKNTRFIPEYAGKLNFYLSAVDDTLKQISDKPSIGILLCRDKNNVEVEFALRGMSQPMGVSEFNLTGALPDHLKSSLPTIEEIENEFRKSKEEVEADTFAIDNLIPKEKWDDFMLKSPISESMILEFASEVAISPSVIYGRLCFENKQYNFKTSITHTIG